MFFRMMFLLSLFDSEILLESCVSQEIQVTVQYVFVVFHTPIFQELVARFHPYPGPRILDWPGVDLWIFDGQVICDVVCISVAEPFDDMQSIAGWMFRSDVQSDSAVKAFRVDDQGIALIRAGRRSH